MFQLIKIAAAVGIITTLSGCSEMRTRGQNQTPQPTEIDAQQMHANHLSEIAVTADTTTGGNDAVSAALEWSEKYAKISETLRRVQNEKHLEENKVRKLKAEVSKLQTQLKRTTKELDESNVMLVEVHKELNRWKKDVLGFRGEIRHAQKTQLHALGKIMRLLGGELQQPTTRPAADLATNTEGHKK